MTTRRGKAFCRLDLPFGVGTDLAVKSLSAELEGSLAVAASVELGEASLYGRLQSKSALEQELCLGLCLLKFVILKLSQATS